MGGLKVVDAEPPVKEKGEGCMGSLSGAAFACSKSKLLPPNWNETSSHPRRFP